MGIIYNQQTINTAVQPFTDSSQYRQVKALTPVGESKKKRNLKSLSSRNIKFLRNLGLKVSSTSKKENV